MKKRKLSVNYRTEAFKLFQPRKAFCRALKKQNKKEHACYVYIYLHIYYLKTKLI